MNHHFQFALYFSFGQFVLYDAASSWPEFEWNERNSEKGLALAPHGIGLSTLYQDGWAEFEIKSSTEAIDFKDFNRIHEVTLALPSGQLAVDSPDDLGRIRLKLSPRNYLLIIGQKAISDSREKVLILARESAESRPYGKVLKMEQ